MSQLDAQPILPWAEDLSGLVYRKVNTNCRPGCSLASSSTPPTARRPLPLGGCAAAGKQSRAEFFAAPAAWAQISNSWLLGFYFSVLGVGTFWF